MSAIIVLSCGENYVGGLSERCKERVERAIRLYDDSKHLVMTGGIITGNSSDAQAMKKYAVERGILPSSIYLEENALDTIGNAIFTKKDVVFRQGWNSLTIVTHESHMKRVQEVFPFVYGDGYNLAYEGVQHTIPLTPEEMDEEQKSLSLFYDKFSHIPTGDHDAMLEQLLDGSHPCYKKVK